jgi:hypothetical protein
MAPRSVIRVTSFMTSYQIYFLASEGEVVRTFELVCADDQDAMLKATNLRGVDEVEIEIWERTRLVGWLPVPPVPRIAIIWERAARLITLIAISTALAMLARALIKWSVETLSVT